ncbi:MAG: M48 family metallopeptidase [Acidobacteria bacterium]|nr:M48 family metallopeptidase [Acidobacteriota bacterium]
MNIFFIVILAAVVGQALLAVASGLLNARAFSPTVPAEFAGVFDVERYARAQRYAVTRARFRAVRTAVDLAVLLAFWFAGGFAWLDEAVRSLGYGPVVTGLLYIGGLGLASAVLALPFRVYSTFVIEARFDFNRTTPATFAADLVKGLVLAALLGGPLLAVVLAFFAWAGPLAWLWCWIAATAALLVVQFVAPTWILPLFNTFTPVESGDLRDAVVRCARDARFPLRGIFVVDGSRRSSKANAFFTGFGRNKRIGLYDTLVADYSVPELVAVVAHEIGHYRRGHIWRGLALSVGYLGATLWILSFFLEREALFAAFGVSEPSVYAGLVFFSLLFAPIDLALSLFVNRVSRQHEFEADRFAAETTGGSEPLIAALKKLSADTLTNLTPHPLVVALEYSHPPVLQRIDALRRAAAG